MKLGTWILGSGVNYFYFNTSDDTGAPATLAGTPSLACNVNNGAAATAGITLTVNSGGITGRHLVAVDVDDVTLALTDGVSVDFYIAAGTVDAISVVGKSIGTFVISDGSLLGQTSTDVQAAAAAALTAYDPPTRAELTADVATLATAAALATVDANVDAILVDTGITLQAELDGIQADTEDIQARLPAALNNGAIIADIQRINDVAVTGDGSTTAFGV